VRAAVLSVGSELLLGDLTDTNATWLSARLRELGVDVVHHLAVRDDLDEFVVARCAGSRRAGLVVVGGGLGPTSDDLTREAWPPRPRSRWSTATTSRRRSEGASPPGAGRCRPPTSSRHACPRRAGLPAAGTAPAFALTLTAEPTRVVALPGVPWELQQLFEEHVVPEVLALAGAGATVTRVVHVAGRGESDVAEVVEPVVAGRPDVTLAFLARSQEIEVRLTVRAQDPASARELSQPLVDEVVAALGPSVAGVDEESWRRWCSGCWTRPARPWRQRSPPRRATSARGSAGSPRPPPRLRGGCAVYSEQAKQALLDVPRALLDGPGAVSAEVTEVLAASVRNRIGTDWGLAVTGVAGPDTVRDLPVGTCFWALAHPDGHVEVHGRRIPGDRTQVMARLGSVALDLLRRRLLEH
jgi:nicotinamide-nucleotide amidase